MYPNQDQHQYSIDYLNEIAPKQQKSGMDNKKFLLLVGGGLLLAIIVGIFAFSSGGNGPTEKMQTLAARLDTLRTISTKSQRTIKSSQLRSINSNLTIFLANTTRDLKEPLKNNGVDVTKINDSIKKAESGIELTKTLEDARLNAVFDRKYPREMAYQLDTVQLLLQEIYNSTNSKSLKEALENTDKNLQPLKKQFEDFNAANS